MDKDLDKAYRETTEPKLRVVEADHYLDPGFINERKIFNVFGEPLVSEYERLRDPNTEDHFARYKNGHLLTKLCVAYLKAVNAPTLMVLINNGPQVGQIFCSTEDLDKADHDIFDLSVPRTFNPIISPAISEFEIQLEYSKDKIVADTTRSELRRGETTYTILGQIREIVDNKIIIHPLLMGAPSFQSSVSDDIWAYHKLSHYKVYPEDVDEFNQIQEISAPKASEWMPVMQKLSENEVKVMLAEILGETTKKDWGGEMHDHYSSHLHLNEERKSGAFLLKGPGNGFEEMSLKKHAGKNSDQIFRLQQSPAEILIVQHCHNISEEFEATLRAFAVSPQNPRFYCLIDGRDTYRILKAYKKI